jgi:GntR family transcriptional repressor for pyruvate dehydrogenase complex
MDQLSLPLAKASRDGKIQGADMTDSVHSRAAERSELPFRPASTSRAHEHVVDQIVFMIRAGLLEPGDRLPTIENLAELTHVSKPVVGEAVRLMRNRGILLTKRGVQGGVTVASDDIPTDLMRLVSDWREATLSELVEARQPIELQLALLAAERGKPAEFRRMATSLVKLRDAYDNGTKGTYLRYDHLFHYQIGLAARSENLAYFQHRILSEIAAMLDDYGLFHEDFDLVIETHQSILDALMQRDADAVTKAVDSHWRTSSGAFASLEALANDDN